MKKQKQLPGKENGSALVYILLAIAVLGVLTATFMDSSSQQVSSQKSVDVTTDLKTQIEYIRSAIQECVLSYPKGDRTMPATNPVGGPSGHGQYPVRPYPLRPSNNYLAGTLPSGSVVPDIRCPGNPGDNNNHVKIFTAAKPFPAQSPYFGPWYYYNDIDGVFFMTQTTKTDAFLGAALQKLDNQFSKCESQYIDATGGTVQTTSNGATGYQCAAGYRCIVIRMVTTGTTIYPGETGCP